MYYLIKIIKTIAFRQEISFHILLTLIIWYFITHSPQEIYRQAKKFILTIENMKTWKNLKSQLSHNRSNTSPYQVGTTMNFLTYVPWLWSHRNHGVSSSFSKTLGHGSVWRAEFCYSFHNLLTYQTCSWLPRCSFSLKEVCGDLAHCPSHCSWFSLSSVC
jgi:hypothetical protein